MSAAAPSASFSEAPHQPRGNEAIVPLAAGRANTVNLAAAAVGEATGHVPSSRRVPHILPLAEQGMAVPQAATQSSSQPDPLAAAREAARLNAVPASDTLGRLYHA